MPSIRNGNRLVTQIAVIEPEPEKRTELRSALTSALTHPPPSGHSLGRK
jgi:hypothetical protein